MSELNDGDFNQVMTAALALLARREHSQHELEQKLSRRCDDPEVVDRVLLALAERGLQSDERFCESFVRYRIDQGKGPFAIRADLRKKGLSEDLVQRHLRTDDEFWSSRSQHVYLRKFGDAPVDNDRDRAKRLRFMVSRGFPAHIVYPLIEA